jgi:hypothetical protein
MCFLAIGIAFQFLAFLQVPAPQPQLLPLPKRADGSFLTVWDLLDHTTGIRMALEDLNQRLLEADAEGEE